MAAGDTMQGKRVEDPAPFDEGAYWLQNGNWYCVTPGKHYGNLTAHEVTEHEDGTITVSPSILVRGGRDGTRELWHGYLERGVWREV